jgi:hypothetical protein
MYAQRMYSFDGARLAFGLDELGLDGMSSPSCSVYRIVAAVSGRLSRGEVHTGGSFFREFVQRVPQQLNVLLLRRNNTQEIFESSFESSSYAASATDIPFVTTV